jgi:acetyl esterase/lipase
VIIWRLYLIESMLLAGLSVNGWRAVRFQPLRWTGFLAAYPATEVSWQIAAIQAGLSATAALAGAGTDRYGRIALALSVLGVAVLGWLAVGHWRTRGSVDRALDALQLRRTARRALDVSMIVPRRQPDSSVRVVRAVPYAEVDGTALALDIWLPAEPVIDAPCLIQVHGGGWSAWGGTRASHAVPLMATLAEAGWISFAIDYRLSPAATFPDHVTDVKRAIAWVKANAESYGGNPNCVVLTGGSAGAHLAALAALTPGEHQSGFEDADTTVQACVGLYGIYDLTSARANPAITSLVRRGLLKTRLDEDHVGWMSASPLARVHRDAPPFLVIHGERDSIVDFRDSRDFARSLAAVSTSPVGVITVPTAQHGFDTIWTVRTAAVVDGIERFLEAVRTGSLGTAT